MDTRTYKTLSRRLAALELDLDASAKPGSTLAVQLGQIQQKLDMLYSSNAELTTLQEILKAVKMPSKDTAVHPRISEAEKQEMLLVKYPIIIEAYNNLIELLNMEIPRIEGYNLDVDKMLQKRKALELLAGVFHALVLKNLAVFEKYTQLLERENNFWMNVEKRMNAVGARASAIERKQQLENKY